MGEDEYFKFAPAEPADLARRLILDEAACALLMPEQSVAEFVVDLAGVGQFPAAIAVLAHALPKREAVWWGCVAVRLATAPTADSPADAALRAAEAWVYQPLEQNRQAAREAAARAGLRTPAGWAAIAAFWSSGSMAPPDTPEVLPKEDLTARAVAGAVALAAVQADPAHTGVGFEAIIGLGLDIARGGDGRHMPG